MQRESLATFLIAMMIVSAGMGALSWRSGPTSYAPLPTTLNTTEIIPCSISLLNQTTTTTTSTSTSATPYPDYGPLLGNLSSISVLARGTGLGGGSSSEETVHVLNRSSSAHGETYLLNVTIRESGPSQEIQTSVGTTTTITTANQTSVGSEVVRVSSNGSIIAEEGSSGNLTSTLLPLGAFLPLAFFAFPTASSEPQVLNRTDVTIGGTSMYVTNYLLPSEAVTLSEQACPGGAFTSATLTLEHLTIQAGVVPGTKLTLVTRYFFAEELGPPITSTPSTLTFVESVISFTVAK